MSPRTSSLRRARGRRSDDEASGPPSTLQSLLEAGEQAASAAAPSTVDAVALLRHLDVAGRFHRDSGIGRLFHPGRLSLRANVASNSLHVVVEDNRVAAPVDRVSPLGVQPEGSSRYSVRRALAHNLVGMAQDLVELLRGGRATTAASSTANGCLVRPRTPIRELSSSTAKRRRGACRWRLGFPVPSTNLGCGLRWMPPSEGTPTTASTWRWSPVPTTTTWRLPAADSSTWPPLSPSGPPLKVLLARHPAGDVLMLNLNYAVADASAALRVLHAIAAAYAGSSDHMGGLDLLATSDLPVRPAPPAESILVGSAKRAIERLRDVLARPALLAVDQPEDRAGYGFHLVRLSAEDTARSGTSRNVLMAALHLAMGDWNLQHGTPGRRLHVLAPVNLRPPEWEEDPIANFLVTARVSTTRRERRGPASALKAITAQTTRNRRTRTGIALLAAMERSGLLPMWAKQSTVVLQRLTGNLLVDNAMLCNLGALDEAPRFGPDVGEASELWFSTPSRSPLAVCPGAVTLHGRLHLTFRYPHRLFGPDAARRFAECYLRQVRLVAESRT